MQNAQPSPQAMKNLHALIARLLPKYQDQLAAKAREREAQTG